MRAVTSARARPSHADAFDSRLLPRARRRITMPRSC